MTVNLVSFFRLLIMECLNPQVISIRSKVLAPLFNERLKMEIRCGKCANCQATLQREWYYRAVAEYKSTIAKGGYMLMDCLSYDDEYVPKMSRFYPNLPDYLNYMCFDYFDLRYFLVRLRDYLKKRGFNVKDTLRYFAAAEYGTKEFYIDDHGKQRRGTHRPHYHVLFYVTTPNLDNITLSKAISACWHYGHTDGIPFKSVSYVNNYTIREGLASSQRCCKYVSKYVMKNSAYQKVIDKRINSLLYYYYENKSFKYYRHGDWCFDYVDFDYRKPVEVIDYDSFESFLRSTAAKKLKSDLMRYMNQFHRQSLGFGASAVDSMDIDSIIKTNVVSLSDGRTIVMRLGLPSYFRRKLFYHVIEVNGMKSWILNNDVQSLAYKQARDNDKKRLLYQKLQVDQKQYNLCMDIDSMVDYLINHRWFDKNRIFNEDLDLIQKLQLPQILYNYSTRTDAHKFHGKFITDVFLGNSQTDYVYNCKPLKHINVVDFTSYLELNAYVDIDKEQILSLLKEKKRLFHDSIQKNFDNKQRLLQVYKNLR